MAYIALDLKPAGRLALRFLRYGVSIIVSIAGCFFALGILFAPHSGAIAKTVLAVVAMVLFYITVKLWPHRTRRVTIASIEGRLGTRFPHDAKRPMRALLETNNTKLSVLIPQQAAEPLLREGPLLDSESRYNTITIVERHTAKPVSKLSGLPTLDDLIRSIDWPAGSMEPATDNQCYAIDNLGFGTSTIEISREQAHALLSARQYACGVLQRVGPALEEDDWNLIEASLVAFVATDAALRKRATEWSNRSYARGAGAMPSPRKDEHWDKVVSEAKRLVSRVVT
jgi:hypothetical protein